MPQIDPVILQLRAEVKQYQNDVRATTTLVTNQLDRQERSILSLDHQVDRSTKGISRGFAVINQSALAFAGGFALGTVIREVISLADQSKKLEAQLRLATDGFGSFGQAQTDVERISTLTRSSLEATTKLYGGFLRASKETGRSQNDAARATQTFAEALKIGGAGAEEAASATLQFNQALQSGVLRGDEFNSILEASPRIARLLADGIGVPIGKLREMAEQGKITSDVLFRALTDRKFTVGIDAEFKRIPVTFGDAMQLVENAALTTFGAFDKGGRFSEALASFVGAGADGFKSLADSAEAEGSNIRATFEGLSNVFSPMLSGAQSAFGGIRSEANYTRDSIANILSGVDQLRNFLPDIQRRAQAFDERTFGRRTGFTGDIGPRSNLAGGFQQGFRRSQAQSRRDAAASRLESLGFTVPRNADGSINEAGIVRRAAAPARPRVSAPAASGGAKSRARGGGRAAANAKVNDLPDVAELMESINGSLRDISSNAAAAMRPESEKLDEATRRFENYFGREGKDYADPFGGNDEFDAAIQKASEMREEGERDLQNTRERNVYQLAGLYESLFQEGTDGIWQNFKDQGLRTLALIAAQATIASFSKGGGGIGSLLGNIGSAASSAFSQGGTFGRASGGYVAPRSVVRVNEGRGGVELLRMGGQGGTVIPLGETKAQRPGGSSTIVNQSFNLDARYGITTPELLNFVQATARSEGTRAGGAAFVASQRSTPGTLAQYDKLEG